MNTEHQTLAEMRLFEMELHARKLTAAAEAANNRVAVFAAQLNTAKNTAAMVECLRHENKPKIMVRTYLMICRFFLQTGTMPTRKQIANHFTVSLEAVNKRLIRLNALGAVNVEGKEFSLVVDGSQAQQRKP